MHNIFEDGNLRSTMRCSRFKMQKKMSKAYIPGVQGVTQKAGEGRC